MEQNRKDLSYPISKLNSLDYLGSNMFFELVIDDYGDKTYVNTKVPVLSFFDYVISSHPIFNKINDIFNDRTVIDINTQTDEEIFRYSSDMYISGQTYFLNNPYCNDSITYSALTDYQTVTKKQLEQYIHTTSLEIDTIKNYSMYTQYLNDTGWTKLNKNNSPVYSEFAASAFKKSADNCKINEPIGDNIYGTKEIEFNLNTFATIIGKVKIFNYTPSLTTPYYTPEKNLWAAVYCNNNIIAMTELHNVTANGVAYFSFQLPIIRGQTIRVIVPFQPISVVEDSTNSSNNSHDIFKNISINSICIFYYSGNSTLFNKMKFTDFNL